MKNLQFIKAKFEIPPCDCFATGFLSETHRCSEHPPSKWQWYHDQEGHWRCSPQSWCPERRWQKRKNKSKRRGRGREDGKAEGKCTLGTDYRPSRTHYPTYELLYLPFDLEEIAGKIDDCGNSIPNSELTCNSIRVPLAGFQSTTVGHFPHHSTNEAESSACISEICLQE